MGVPQYGWFSMENPPNMDDLGIPLFEDPPTCPLSVLPKHPLVQVSLLHDFRAKDDADFVAGLSGDKRTDL